VGSEAASWDLVKHEQDLVIYETKVPGSDVVAFKGRGVIHQPVIKVAAVLLDGQHAREWVGHLEESHTVRRISPTEYIQYNHIGTPFVMKDRDFVVRITIDLLPEKRAVHVHYQSTADPLAPHTDYVRGEIIDSDFLLTALEPKTTMVLEATMHADPKGTVPKWIVNLLGQIPRSLLRLLQRCYCRFMSDYLHKRHNVSALIYHIGCPAKSRRVVVSQEVDTVLKEVCVDIAKRYEIAFLEIGTDHDHVHFLVQSVPPYSPTKIVKIIKSLTAREIFARVPAVKKQLWGGAFWSKGYFISTVGRHGNEEVIRQYVKNQGTAKSPQPYTQLHRQDVQLELFKWLRVLDPAEHS